MCISVNGTTTTLLLDTIYTHTVYTSRVVADIADATGSRYCAVTPSLVH